MNLAKQLAAQPELARPWKFLVKRNVKEAALQAPPAASRQERDLLPDLLAVFVEAIVAAGNHNVEVEPDDGSSSDDADEAEVVQAAVTEANAARPLGHQRRAAANPSSHAGLVRYLERTMELIIDLLAQLPTRRFFHTVLLDTLVLERASLSAFARAVAPARRFRQLLALAKFYEAYEIDNHRGTPISDPDVKALRCEQLVALQKAAFRMDGLQDFALSNLSAIDSAAALGAHFGRLNVNDLCQLTETLGLAHSHDQAETLGKPFLVHLLVSRQVDPMLTEPVPARTARSHLLTRSVLSDTSAALLSTSLFRRFHSILTKSFHGTHPLCRARATTASVPSHYPS